MRTEPKFNIKDPVWYSCNKAVIVKRAYGYPVGKWTYIIMYDTGEHTRWIAEDNLQPGLTEELVRSFLTAYDNQDSDRNSFIQALAALRKAAK